MELQQIVSLTVFVAVYVAFATRLVHKALATLAGALVLAWIWSPGVVLGAEVPEALLVTAGLMVMAGFVKRSGLASWLALKAAKAGRGRPGPILVLTGVLTFVTAALLGPVAAVALVVPVTLLLAVELDVPPLPFVAVLSWAALLGGTTVMTAQASNLWIALALGVDAGPWFLRMAPLAGVGLAATLATTILVFRTKLRVTNERRARVLEYDESRSLDDRPLVLKTVVALVLVGAGLVVRPWVPLDPAAVVLTGAVLLMLADGPRSIDRSLAEVDGPGLLYLAGLFIVVGALEASGLLKSVASLIPGSPWAAVGGSAVLGALVDHEAVAGGFVPLLRAWASAGAPGLWAYVVLGASIGAGITTWGATSSATALALGGRGSKTITWPDLLRTGLLLGVVNLAVVLLLGALLA